jgi:hypothetical protein
MLKIIETLPFLVIGNVHEFTMDEQGIMTVRVTMDRIRLSKALYKLRKHVVIQRFAF